MTRTRPRGPRKNRASAEVPATRTFTSRFCLLVAVFGTTIYCLMRLRAMPVDGLPAARPGIKMQIHSISGEIHPHKIANVDVQAVRRPQNMHVVIRHRQTEL